MPVQANHRIQARKRPISFRKIWKSGLNHLDWLGSHNHCELLGFFYGKEKKIYPCVAVACIHARRRGLHLAASSSFIQTYWGTHPCPFSFWNRFKQSTRISNFPVLHNNALRNASQNMPRVTSFKHSNKEYGPRAIHWESNTETGSLLAETITAPKDFPFELRASLSRIPE